MSAAVLVCAVAGVVLVAVELSILLAVVARNGRVLARLDAIELRISSARDPGPPPVQLADLTAPGDADAGPPTLLALSMTTARKDLIYLRWAREGRLPAGVTPPEGAPGNNGALATAGAQRLPSVMEKRHFHPIADGDIAPVYLQDESTAPGAFAVFDWQTGEMTWSRAWGPRLWAPCGFCFADGVMYLIDSIGCAVLTVDVFQEPGQLLGRISHRYLNDPHSLVRTSRGFLISSAGTDLILELDLDGRLLYEWWATEHGYAKAPSGITREAGRGQEHRDKLYPTGVVQTTHVNEALFRDAEERYLLASLFHSGEIVQIDRSLRPSKQRAEVLLGGLKHPHGLRKTPFGWMLANSAGREVLLLDDDFRVKDRVQYETSWIQDCAVLSSGDLVLNDVARSCLVQFAGPPWRPVRVTPYPELWRGHHLLEVPPEYQAGFRAAAAAMAARPFTREISAFG